VLQALERGCRCIEIDVWNGDTPSANTPNRAVSPNPAHRRQISGNSLPTVTATVKDTVEGARQILSERFGSGSRPSSAIQTRELDLPAQDPRDSTDLVADSPRARSRSHTRSSYTKTEPIVTHGWTAVVPCGFREVCCAIRESAFVTNDLPVIISLEVHTDQEQQEVMVQIMKEEWAGLLLEQSLEGLDPKFRLPTLGELRNKILVKVKKPPHKTDIGTAGSSLAIHSTLGIDDDGASGSEDERCLQLPGALVTTPLPIQHRKAKRVPICQNLGALAIYTHSEHFQTFETPAAKKPSHVFSISESRILELHTTKHSELFVHNKGFFMRAFPKGTRFDSSNLDPSFFWRKGVQMVAMNWQSLDEGMMLNEAMFADELGWVLKPPGYRSTDKQAVTQAQAAPHRTLDLVVSVLAGQNTIDPHAVVDGGATNDSRALRRRRPIVKVELHVERPEERNGKMIEGGGMAREGEYKKWTRAFKGDHPDFGDDGCPLVFAGIPNVVEELSFVR
jgi:phosphatidylinositol phospholipase C, delta